MNISDKNGGLEFPKNTSSVSFQTAGRLLLHGRGCVETLKGLCSDILLIVLCKCNEIKSDEHLFNQKMYAQILQLVSLH